MFADEFLPTYDVSDSVAVVVEANPARTWDALTDEHARRMFRRYWTFGVGSGAHVLVHGVIDRAREIAESAVASPEPVPQHAVRADHVHAT